MERDDSTVPSGRRIRPRNEDGIGAPRQRRRSSLARRLKRPPGKGGQCRAAVVAREEPPVLGLRLLPKRSGHAQGMAAHSTAVRSGAIASLFDVPGIAILPLG